MTLKYIPLCRRIPIAQSGGSSKSWRSTVYYDPTTGQYFSENREPLSVLHKLGDNPANWTYTDSQNRIYSPTNQNNQGEITQGKTPSFFDRFIANSERNYNNPILGVPARYSYAIKNNTDPVTGVVSFMPGVGDAIDIASAGINALRGNWGDAAVYGTAAALPVVDGKMLRAFTSKVNKLKDEVFKPKLQDALNITPTTSSVDLSNLTRTETPTTRDPFSRERDILNRAAQAREDQYIRIGNAAAENKKMLDEQKINEAREAAAKARQDAFDRATRQYQTNSNGETTKKAEDAKVDRKGFKQYLKKPISTGVQLLFETKNHNFNDWYQTRNAARILGLGLIGGQRLVKGTGEILPALWHGVGNSSRSDSTKTDTTKVNNQTSTQPIAPTKYPTLDSMDQVVNRELLYLDSLNHAN